MSDENKDGMGQVRELVTKIREEIGTRHTDLQAKLDGIEKAREGEKADLGKIREELAAIKAQATERENTIREIERRNTLRLEADPAQKREKAIEIYGTMIMREFCRARNVEFPERFKTQREGLECYVRERMERDTLDHQTTAGGYFMPTILVVDIYDTLEEVSPLLGVVDFQTGVPTKGSQVTLTGRPTLQPKRASSNTALPQTDPAFGQYDWNTDEASIYFPVDNWMLQLSPVQLGSRMLVLARDAFMQGLVNWLINADGTAAYNSNTGMLADTANTVRMAGTAFASLTNGDMRKLMLGVLLRARRIGQFVGSGYAISILEDIEREGKMPILREQADGSYRVKGKVFNEDEGMPDEGDSAADSPFLGFGDPKTWAVVLAGAGLQIAADSSHRFQENQTGFRALGHVAIVRKPGNTWALLATKAS